MRLHFVNDCRRILEAGETFEVCKLSEPSLLHFWRKPLFPIVLASPGLLFLAIDIQQTAGVLESLGRPPF